MNLAELSVLRTDTLEWHSLEQTTDLFHGEPPDGSPARSKSPTESPSPFLRASVRSFQKVAGAERRDRRAQIVQAIRDSESPPDSAQTVLEDLLNSASPRRIDDAIDILVLLGERSALDLLHDALKDTREPVTEYENNYGYVLIKALAHHGTSEARLWTLWLCDKSLPLVGMREAAIEALGEFSDNTTKNKLQRIAADSDEHEFFRDLAREVLSESNEEE